MPPSLFRFRKLLLLLVVMAGVAALPAWGQAEAADFASTLKAAEQGNADAQATLGMMYQEGAGVPQDYQQALAWYTKAGEQGHTKAQVNLAVMYFEGQGFPQNFSLAYVWSSLAAATGDKMGIKNRDLVAAKLTPQGIAEAQAQSALIEEKIHNLQTQADISSVPPAPQSPALGPTSSVSGTGFIITPAGHILTCAHVVAKARAIKVIIGEQILEAKVVRLDTESDLALLKVSTSAPMPALAFSPDRSVMLGQDVFTVGFPNPELQGNEAKLTKGSVSGMAGVQDDPRLYQISVPIQPGNSGGPLLDNSGEVVGVVVSRLRDKLVLKLSGSLPQNINYAIKSVYAQSLIDSLPEVASKLPAPNAGQRSFADAALLAERGVVQVLAGR